MRLPAALIFAPLVLGAAACRKETPSAPASSSATATESAAPATSGPENPEEAGDSAGKEDATTGSSSSVRDEVAAAAQDGDREKLLRNWSTASLVDELERRGFLGELDAAAKARAKSAIDEHFELLASYLEKRIGESRRLYHSTLVPPDIHVSLERTRQHDGSRDTVMRFWFREHEGRMQLVDCEDLTLGYRASTLMLGLVAPQDQPWLKPLMALMEKVNQAGDESTFQVAVRAAKEVDALLAAEPPDDLKAFALKLKAERLIMQRKHADALKVIKEFSLIEPKSPWADYLRGLALMNLHRGFEAITAFRRYAEATGWDATTHEYVGWCHFSQGDEKTALEHAKKGLELNKDAYGCLVTAVLSSKPEEIAGLSGYFKNTFDPENTYEYVMDQVIDMEDRKVAKAVFALLEKDLPNSELVPSYRKKLEATAE